MLLTVEIRSRKRLDDSQTNQEISRRNEARLNDVFPQERGDYLWEKAERKCLSKMTSKESNETVATKHW